MQSVTCYVLQGDGSVDVPCGGPMDGGCVWRSLAKLVVFTPAELEVLSGANPGTLKDLRSPPVY